ncbi:MAG: hypothetical protein KKD44_12040 [Proteobacteria bacterium]|nr:hypothetical protein [Pseudomonadota bacterium]
MDNHVSNLIDQARQADDTLYELAGYFLTPAAYKEFRKLYINTRNKWITATAEDYRNRIRKITSNGNPSK